LAIADLLGLPADAGSLARIEVRNAPSGAPEVDLDGDPAGVAVSLTDRAGWAVCAAGPAGPGFGCDLELIEPRSPQFVRDFLTGAEQRLVAAAAAADRPVVANLVWSAKESALKAMRTGLRQDTRSVEVRFPAGGAPAGSGPAAGGPAGSAGAAPAGGGAPAGWLPLAVRLTGGPELPGWWLRCGAFLLTVAGAGLAAPPVSIEDPPALATAAPRPGGPGSPG
jgi:4'-phosphopantetheinyl transferase